MESDNYLLYLGYFLVLVSLIVAWKPKLVMAETPRRLRR